jgi:pimeloyl-ACP methyl ester carboxylesterase
MKHPIAAALAFVLLLPACVLKAPPLTPAQLAVVYDPPRHATRPARNRQLVIPSGPVRPELGRPAEMNALFLLAAGEGPRPTLLLLHGLPGNERNLDLAQAVRRSGWNVLTFTYRGAWGSEGTFSLQHAVADTKAALDFLRSPRAAGEFQVDPSRLVLAGHSMGGYMAAHTAAEHGAVGVILLDAWDIAATARRVKAGGAEGRSGFIAAMDDVGRALGPITAADLADNLIRRGEEWDLAALAPRLAALPVLTVYATHGGAAENKAIAERIRSAPGARLTAVELPTDHAFADHRIRLATEVVAWLQGLPRR